LPGQHDGVGLLRGDVDQDAAQRFDRVERLVIAQVFRRQPRGQCGRRQPDDRQANAGDLFH
jgi:hypothetical protein